MKFFAENINGFLALIIFAKKVALSDMFDRVVNTLLASDHMIGQYLPYLKEGIQCND